MNDTAVFQDEIKTLKNVQKAINDKKKYENVQVLTVLIQDVYNSVKHNKMKAYVPFTNHYKKHDSQHENTYLNRWKQNRSLALSKLQDIEMCLCNKSINIKRINKLLDGLIETDFYTANSHSFIDKWKPLKKVAIQNKVFSI